MAKLAGVNVPGNIVPGTTDDSYATHDSFYGRGGWREVASTTERDAITDDRLRIGMAVYVTGTNKVYIYKGEVEDPDTHVKTKQWTEFSGGGGSGSAEWGSIAGTLSAQVDLKTALQDTTAVYRGDYANWTAVPTTNTYKADNFNDTTPHNGNLIVVDDTTDYQVGDIIPCKIIANAGTSSLFIRIEVTRDGSISADEMTMTNIEEGSHWNVGGYLSPTDRAFRIETTADTSRGGTYRVDIKCNVDALYIGNIKYINNEIFASFHAGGTETFDYEQTLEHREVSYPLSGRWTFQYEGTWSTNSKNGWKPAFALGSGGGSVPTYDSATETITF